MILQDIKTGRISDVDMRLADKLVKKGYTLLMGDIRPKMEYKNGMTPIKEIRKGALWGLQYFKDKKMLKVYYGVNMIERIVMYDNVPETLAMAAFLNGTSSFINRYIAPYKDLYKRRSLTKEI